MFFDLFRLIMHEAFFEEHFKSGHIAYTLSNVHPLLLDPWSHPGTAFDVKLELQNCKM